MEKSRRQHRRRRRQSSSTQIDYLLLKYPHKNIHSVEDSWRKLRENVLFLQNSERKYIQVTYHCEYTLIFQYYLQEYISKLDLYVPSCVFLRISGLFEKNNFLFIKKNQINIFCNNFHVTQRYLDPDCRNYWNLLFLPTEQSRFGRRNYGEFILFANFCNYITCGTGTRLNYFGDLKIKWKESVLLNWCSCLLIIKINLIWTKNKN